MNNILREHRVLVTGASGFMGSWLAKYLLDQGATVTTILADWNPNSYFMRSGIFQRVQNVIGSIEDYNLLEKLIGDRGIDTVFHLAAVSVEGLAFEKPRLAFEINIRGTYNVLEACRVHSDVVKRIVVASSDKAYGDSPVLPYTEDLPTVGKNPYDASKSCADMIARTYSHSYGLPVAVGRFGNIYGGGDLNLNRLIPNTIRRLLKNEPPIVRVPTQGSFMRDFLYVKDAVNSYVAMFKGLENPDVHGEAFNFAMGGSWTVLEIVQKIQRIMNREDIEPMLVPQTHGEIWHQHVSTQKAQKVLGWTPYYSFDEGLRETVEWYVEFLCGSVLANGRTPLVAGV
ncbi:MAG: GDP-mannose 4,6-dehydratase [Mojavia pulchra JT2-VF2]|jgi:CDP-glucose 4,6-dehydratase|uniref:GDP-mannose 4,6-dehydratase n=1 Tax=Mojavia pulchra JT2-VF2 TaxID=287848 RepID=A0A951UH54_9NOST|nr:GDP-mannose 4,6-dehydratase [Mojavia pulchra JT2-VF2]